MDHSPPGSSVHGISQAKILEWVAISFSRGPSWPRKILNLLHWQADSLPLSHQGSPMYADTCLLIETWLVNIKTCVVSWVTNIYRSCISSTLLSWISEDTYSFHNSFYFLSSWLENSLFALVTKPKLLVDKGMKSKTCTKGDKPVSLSHPSVAWKCLWGKKRLQEFGCTW